MNRSQASVLLLLLWAAIFLPRLGGPEIKGEEGRRILPAVTMLDSGHWLVPQVGGKPFLRKPPLVNWAIAASFAVTGHRSEWAARLPSVLAVLALGLTIVALGHGRGGWMNAETALVAAIFTLTQLGMVEKGRLAEIEAIYVALTGIALVCWLAWWVEGRSPFLLWIVPSGLLGLGLLTKGPLHLLFFYAVVLAVLWKARELRALRHPAHFAGGAVMLAIFAAWAVPYFRDESTRYATQVWGGQLDRTRGAFDWSAWLTNLPRGLSNHLPWLLLAPLLWRRELFLSKPGDRGKSSAPSPLGPRLLAVVRGARLAVALCFFGLLLMPGVLPRYTLPLLVPFSLVLAIAVADPRFAPPVRALRAWWRANTILALVLLVAACAAPVVVALFTTREELRRSETLADYTPMLFGPLAGSALAVLLCLAVFLGRWKLARPALIAASSAALVGAGMLVYAGSALPLLSRRDDLRPVARAIDLAVSGSAAPLVIYDPEYQPAIFYLRTPYVYAPGLKEIPADAAWVLAREEKRKRLLLSRPDLEVAQGFPAKDPQLILLRRRAGK